MSPNLRGQYWRQWLLKWWYWDSWHKSRRFLEYVLQYPEVDLQLESSPKFQTFLLILFTFVIPGRSTILRSTTLGEKILIIIGIEEIPLFWPAIFWVSSSISCLTRFQSLKYSPFLWLNSAYSSLPLGVLFNWRIIGLLVTIPVPLGKKSLPIMASRTELLPVDWAPTTTSWGNWRLCWRLDFERISLGIWEGV